jgi:hypothetical protein
MHCIELPLQIFFYVERKQMYAASCDCYFYSLLTVVPVSYSYLTTRRTALIIYINLRYILLNLL